MRGTSTYLKVADGRGAWCVMREGISAASATPPRTTDHAPRTEFTHA